MTPEAEVRLDMRTNTVHPIHGPSRTLDKDAFRIFLNNSLSTPWITVWTTGGTCPRQSIVMGPKAQKKMIPPNFATYAISVRAEDDPPTPNFEPTKWLRRVEQWDTKEWAERIVTHVGSESMTFHRIMMDLARIPASFALNRAPENGLWLAVREGVLEFSHRFPVLFRRTSEGAKR